MTTSYHICHSSVCPRLQTKTNFIQLTAYCVRYSVCIYNKGSQGLPLLRRVALMCWTGLAVSSYCHFFYWWAALGAKWKSTRSSGGWPFPLYSEIHSGKMCIHQHSYKQLIRFMHIRASKQRIRGYYSKPLITSLTFSNGSSTRRWQITVVRLQCL